MVDENLRKEMTDAYAKGIILHGHYIQQFADWQARQLFATSA